MRLWLLLVVIIVVLQGSASVLAQGDMTIAAQTSDYTNFREQPSLNASVIQILDPNTPIVLDARTQNGEWMRGVVDDKIGWVFHTLVLTDDDLNELTTVAVVIPETATTNTTTEFESDVEVGEGEIAAITGRIANFRAGPSTAYGIQTTLSADVPLVLTGRNALGNWVQANDNDVVGWIYAPLVLADGEISSLSVVEAPPLTVATTASTATTGGSGGVLSNVGARSQQIFAAGQQLGNRADVFSKVGDSISTNPNFLYPVGVGGVRFGAYAYLQTTVDYFSATGARTHNSFANDSIAVRNGWTSADILSAGWAPAGVCQPGENPLVCEYRTVRPSVALIMVGTNDVLRGVSIGAFQTNLQVIVSTSINMGVIPVLSTIPDINDGINGGRVAAFNNIIRAVAAANATPLWDYWSALQGLPNQGLSSDNYHPSFDPATGQTAIFDGQYLSYGYNVRNLTALQVLDILRQTVLSS